MKEYLKERLSVLQASKSLKLVGTFVAVGSSLVSTASQAAIATTNITAPATDAYDAAVAVINAYGATFLIPVAIISVLWVIGKRFLWRSI